MAFFDTTWYCNSVGYAAVTARPQNTAVAAGVVRRQFTAPAVGSERVFVCIVAGTTANVTDATWSLSRGAKTADGTVTWQECTGASAVNGDLTNTPNWTTVKGQAVTIGQIIQRNSGASYQIASLGGTSGSGSEPAFSNTAGAQTTDNTVTWTCLGPVGSFTGGQAPHARLANACASTWFAAGNTIYVGDNHAETQATTISLAPAGSVTTMGKIICHNSAGSYPPTSVTTGATISTTGAVNINFTPSLAGGFYFYGLTFRDAIGQSSAQNITLGSGGSWFYFDSCSFELATTGVGVLNVGTATIGTIVFNNTTVKFAAVTHTLAVSGQFFWQNTGPVLVSGSSVPNNLLTTLSNSIASISLEAIDLSQLTGNINLNYAASQTTNLLIKDCKLNAATAAAIPNGFGSTIQLVRCSSSAVGYTSSRYQYEGTETTETSITRVGGASDPTGQVQSRKIVTSANAQWLRPFKAEPYAIWNSRTAANVTVTVCGTINSPSLPNNDDIWLEVEYLGSSATPLGTIVNTTIANLLSADAPVAADSSSWSVPATSYPTFDPATVTAVTLSGGNLVATNTGTTSADQGARVANAFGLTSGKLYFEVTLTTTIGGSNRGVGIGTIASTYTGMGGSATTGSVVYLTSGAIYSNGVSQSISLSGTGGGVAYCVAVDLDARLIWFRTGASGNWNNNASFNPATGIGGVAVPAGTMVPFVTFGGSGGAANNVYTANFGASSFVGAVPVGFAAGWISVFTPFKLVATLSSPQPGMAGYIHARVRAAKPSTTYYIDPQIGLS